MRQSEKLLNRIEKLSPAEKLHIAKMILMGVADFDFEDNESAGAMLWLAKDYVIDFEKEVGLV